MARVELKDALQRMRRRKLGARGKRAGRDEDIIVDLANSGVLDMWAADQTASQKAAAHEARHKGGKKQDAQSSKTKGVDGRCS